MANGCTVSSSFKRINIADTHRFDFALATLERRERNFEVAEALCMDAQNKWLTNRDMRTDPFNGSIMYKLGCISLGQGRLEAAVYV